MKTFFVMLIVCYATTFTLQVQAQTKTPKVVKRQVKQQRRIVQGTRSGTLTYGEVKQLQMQQRNIQRTKRRAKADGVVTRKERAVVHHKQNRANRTIYRKKHNHVSRN